MEAEAELGGSSRSSRKRTATSLSDDHSPAAPQKQKIKKGSKKVGMKAAANKDVAASTSSHSEPSETAMQHTIDLTDAPETLPTDRDQVQLSETGQERPRESIELDENPNSISLSERGSSASHTKKLAAGLPADRDALTPDPPIQESQSDVDSCSGNDQQLLRARVRDLEAQLQIAKDSLQKKDSMDTSQSAIFEEMQSLCSCQICLDLIWRPCVLAPCGHIFCIRCLQSYFTKPLDSEADAPAGWSDSAVEDYREIKTLKRRKICPSCRAELACAPVEIWLVRDMVAKVDQGLKLYPDNNALASTSELSPEELRKLKGDDLPSASTLWKDIFDPAGPPRIIFDEMDHVPRCGSCAAEVFEGMCSNPACGVTYDYDEDADYDSEENFVGGHGELSRGTMAARMAAFRANHHNAAVSLEGDMFERGRTRERYEDEEEDSIDFNDSDDDMDGFIDDDGFDDDTDEDEEEEDDFLPGPRRSHNSATEPIQILDDSDDNDSAAASTPEAGQEFNSVRRLHRSGLVDDEAEDEDDDDEDEDEDDDNDDGEDNDVVRSRSRRVIRDSDDDVL